MPKTTINDKLDGIDPAVYKRRWVILSALLASLLVVMLANSGLNLALPLMATHLNLSSLEMTWVVDLYVLVFASLLFTTSTIADRYGRKLVMQIGLAIFLAGTIYAGFFAQSGIEVIVARGIMGIGGAMVMPTTLSIINNVFPKQERAKAIAIWSGVSGGGIALGSIVSGFLLEHFDWQSVFIFGAVIGIIGFSLNQILTPESRDENETPVDWLSGIFSSLGLFGIVYSIIEAPSKGLFEADVLSLLVAGLILIGLFLRRQTKLEHPMLDLALFKNLSFSVSALAVTLAFFALMGVFFSMSQVFQLIMGYGAMESSIRMLPLMMLMVFLSPFVPNIVKKVGTRWTITGGLTLVATAFVLMSQWPTVPEYWQVLGSMLVMMAGMALTMTPATNIMMSSVPRNRAGMGSAMNDTTRELGGALGIAVLGAILSSVYGEKVVQALSGMPSKIQVAAENSLASALHVSESLGATGATVATAAKEAWMTGLSDAMLVAAGIVLIAAIVTAIWLPHRHAPDEDDSTVDEVVHG